MFLGLLELVSIQNQYVVILEKSLFYFPYCTVPLIKGHSPFEGRLEERIAVNFWHCSGIGIFPQGDQSFEGFWVCPLTQILGLIKGPQLFLFKDAN